MNATILPFPRPDTLPASVPSLASLLRRRLDPSLPYFDREWIELCINMHRASGHILTLQTNPERREAAVDATVTALKASLFHALCLQGCPNDARELMQILVRQDVARESNGDVSQ